MSGEKTVSEEAIPLAAPSEDDVNTTPPNPPAKDTKTGWSMPEPVFRKTSGYLPQGYADKFDQTPVPVRNGDSESTAEMPAPDIGPQPDIDSSETPNMSTAAVQTAPKKSSTAKVVFTVLGVIFALALIAVFIAIVYFLFLMPKPEDTF